MKSNNYIYHHIGLPTQAFRENEEYNNEWKFYASGYFESKFGIEWLRIEEDSPLHPLIKTVPHIAFIVENLKNVIKGKKIIYGPNSPTEGVTVCFIEEQGIPIEFLEFDKPEDEVWPNNEKQTNPFYYKTTKEVLFKYEFHHFNITINPKIYKTINIENRSISITEWDTSQGNDEQIDMIGRNTHIAFKVENLKQAIKEKKVIVSPYKEQNGTFVSFIEENRALIKLIQVINTLKTNRTIQHIK